MACGSVWPGSFIQHRVGRTSVVCANFVGWGGVRKMLQLDGNVCSKSNIGNHQLYWRIFFPYHIQVVCVSWNFNANNRLSIMWIYNVGQVKPSLIEALCTNHLSVINFRKSVNWPIGRSFQVMWPQDNLILTAQLIVTFEFPPGTL